MKPRYGRSFTVELKPRSKRFYQLASGQPSLYTAALDLQAEAMTTSMQGFFRSFHLSLSRVNSAAAPMVFRLEVRDKPRPTARICGPYSPRPFRRKGSLNVSTFDSFAIEEGQPDYR